MHLAKSALEIGRCRSRFRFPHWLRRPFRGKLLRLIVREYAVNGGYRCSLGSLADVSLSRADLAEVGCS